MRPWSRLLGYVHGFDVDLDSVGQCARHVLSPLPRATLPFKWRRFLLSILGRGSPFMRAQDSP
jgi:hypothetical protein